MNIIGVLPRKRPRSAGLAGTVVPVAGLRRSAADDGRSDVTQQAVALPAGVHRPPFEVVALEPHVGVEPGGVGVEMHEGPGPAVEGARLFLDEPVDGPQARQQVLELDQIVRCGVPHGPTVPRQREGGGRARNDGGKSGGLR